MARFVWSDARFTKISEMVDALEKEPRNKPSNAHKRVSTMELFEQICRDDLNPSQYGLKDEERPTFKLVPEHDGIEIYFDVKPNTKIINDLKANKWRWHPVKQCWYNRKSTESLAFAISLCKPSDPKSARGLPTLSSMETYSNIAPPEVVSFDMLSGNQVIGTLSVKKKNHRYAISSTNNLMPCCDCYNYFSIHAPACPFCGCPSSFVAEHYYREGTKDYLKQVRIEAAQRKREEEKHRQELELAEARRQAAEKRRQVELARKQAEQERKHKEEERFRTRAAEIREICKKLSLPDKIVKELVKSAVDNQTLRVRVDRILYYQSACPELGIQASQFIINDDIGKYVSEHTVSEYDKRVDCIGDCSTCRRDECVLTKRR